MNPSTHRTCVVGVLLTMLAAALLTRGGAAAPTPDRVEAGPASTPTPFYDYKVVARQGEGNVDLFGWPSINDRGEVAFLGTVVRPRTSPVKVATVFVAHESGSVDDLTPDVLGGAPNLYDQLTPPDLARGVEINAGGQVAAHSESILHELAPFRLLLHGSYAFRFPVLGSTFWGPVRAAGNLANATAQTPDPAYYRLVGPWVSMNDHGEIAFIAGDGDVAFTGPAAGLEDVVADELSLVVAPDLHAPELLDGYREHVLDSGRTLDLAATVAPMIANDGRVVVRAGFQDISPLEVFRRDLSSSERLAGPDLGFTRVGGFPAISDDGRAVAFFGDRGEGEGLFLAIDDGSGYAASGVILRVVGENATPYPELGWGDPLTTTEADGSVRDDLPPLFFESFGFRQRLGIIHVEKGRPGFLDDSVTIAFIARPNASSRMNPVVPGSPLLFSDREGLWTARVDFEKHPETGLLTAQPRSAIPVVQVGDVLEGALVSSVSVYDPLAAARSDLGVFEPGRGDHRVAFSVTTSAGRRIVQATHLDTDEDGLLDHWETRGIDMDGDGEVDLDLNAMGADPLHKDLFLEVDWLVPRTRGTIVPWSNELQPGVTERLVQMFAEAPVQNPDGNPGITLHVDAGPGVDRVYRRPFSQDMPPGPLLQGGDLVHKPGLPSQHLDVVPLTGGYRMPASIASERFGVLKDLFFGTRDKRARELAFHYAILADFHDVVRDPGEKPYVGTVTAVSADGALFEFSGVPPSLLQDEHILVTSGVAAGEIMFVSLQNGAMAPQRLSRSPGPGDTFCVLDDHGGIAEEAFSSSGVNLPGNDHMLTLGSHGQSGGILGTWFQQWTTLAHELGHNQGLVHCGTELDDSRCDDVHGGVTYRPVNAAIVSEGGVSYLVDVTLTARPDAPVTVDFLSEFDQLEALPARLTFGADTWNVSQRVEIRAVDDTTRDRIDSGTESDPWSFEELHVILASDDVRFENPGEISVRLYDNEVAGLIALTDPEELAEIVEGGPADSYDIVLTRQPVGLVEVRLDASGPIRFSPATLIFGPGDWNTPRTITVWSETDGVALRPYSISYSFRGDPAYDSLAIDVPFTFHDRESPYPLVTESGDGTEVTEGGAADQILVELTTAPEGNVTFRIRTQEVDASPSSVTFTPSNWNVARLIEVRAVDDERQAEGFHRGQLSLITPGDPIPIKTITVDVTDNDFEIEVDHRSLMSYAHLSPQSAVNDYAGPGEPLVDEWSRTKLDFYNVFIHLGALPSDPYPNLDMSRKEYLELFGRPPDVTPPDLVLPGAAGRIEVPLSSSSLIRIRAQDADSGMKGVSALVDTDGDGTIAVDEVFPAVRAGAGYYELTLPGALYPAGPHPIRILAEDTAGNYRIQELVLDAVPEAQNAPPMARDALLTTGADTPVAILLEASDANLAPLTFLVADPPAHGLLTGTPPHLLYTPSPGFVGFDIFTFRASDGLTESNAATVRLMVGSANRPPVIDPAGPVVIPEGTALEVAVAASDPDGNPVALTATGLPGFATFTDHGGGSGTLTLSPSLADVGAYGALRIEAFDGLLRGVLPVPVTVVPYNDPPTLHPIGNLTAWESFTVRYTIAASDADGDAPLFSIDGLPGFGSFEPLAGRNLAILEFSPALFDAGSYPLTVSVSDGLLVTSESFILTVSGDTGSPQIMHLFPPDGSTMLQGRQTIRVKFSKPMDLATLTPARFQLTASGVPVAPFTFEHRSFGSEVILTYAPLPPGGYELTLDAPAITTYRGTPLGDEPFVASRFTLVDRLASSTSLFPDRVYETTGLPSAILSADLNEDGFPDLVTRDAFVQFLAVFFGNGDGTFTDRTSLFCPCRSVAVGDVNGDGHQDIVTAEPGANSNNTTLVSQLGNGDGTFGPRIQSALALQLQEEILLADMDHDGRLDALTRLGNLLSFFRGGGDGSFTFTRITSITSLNSVSGPLAVADADGDGHLDVLSAQSVHLGDGAGGFVQSQSLLANGTAQGFALGDLNEDGWVDMAVRAFRNVPNNLATVSIRLNNGNGTFASEVVLDSRYDATLNLNNGLALSDLDADGHLDVVTGGIVLGVQLGAGDGTFGPRSHYPTVRRPHGFVIEDFDGDGDSDVVHCSGQAAVIGVLFGRGDGTFPVHPDYEAGLGTASVDAGDLDADGDLDIAAVNTGPQGGQASVSIFMGSGDGIFDAPVHYAYGVFGVPPSARIRDLDGDGFPELITTSSAGMSVFPNNGDGTFGAPASHAVSQARSTDSGDLDGDGDIDVAVASGGVAIYVNDGHGTLSQFSVANTAAAVSSVALGDMDGDGDLDLVAKADGFPHVRVSLNNGGGLFTTTPTLPSTGAPGGTILLADVNADGVLDILTGSKDQGVLLSRKVSVLLGLGGGAFATHVDYDGANTGSLAVGLFDEDEHPDIIMASSWTSAVTILLGADDGTFGRKTVYDSGPFSVGVAPGDWNGDGRLDFVTANLQPDTTLADNGSISPRLQLGSGTASGFPTADAGPDRTVDVGDIVVLDGRASLSSSPAAPLAFDWTQIAGPEASPLGTDTSTPSFLPAERGIYVFELTVTAAGKGASDTVTIEARGRPDLVLSGTDGTTAVVPGATVVRSLAVTNKGNVLAEGVILTDTLPPQAVLVASDGGSLNGPSIEWGPFRLAPRETATRSLTLRIATTVPAGVEQVVHTASVFDDGSSGADPTPDDNTVVDSNELLAAPDLSVTLDDGRSGALPGNLLEYGLVVRNLGNQEATGVLLRAAIPPRATFVSVAGGSFSGGEASWPPFTLPAGDTAVRSFTVRLDDLWPPGLESIKATATVGDDGANGPDPRTDDNLATDTDAVALPDLGVSLDDGRDALLAGQTTVYRITVVNRGASTASGVILTDQLPSHTLFVSASHGGVSTSSQVIWPPFDLPSGSAAERTLTLQVAGTIDDTVETLVNSVSVQDDGTHGPDPVPDDNQRQDVNRVTFTTDLSVVQTASPATGRVDEPLLHRIDVVNGGDRRARAVRLDLSLSPRVVLRSIDPGTARCSASAPVSCDLGDLLPGAGGSILVTVVPALPGPVTSLATVSSLTADPDLIDNRSEITTPVTEAAPPFTENAAALGLATPGAKEGGLAWCDFNDDGLLDALVNAAESSFLYFNDGAGFHDVTASHAAGLLAVAADRSAICADLNNDGYVDFARNGSSRIEIYLNGGPRVTPPFSFGTPPGQRPHQVIDGMLEGMDTEGMGFLDYDHDGDLDLVVDNDRFGIDLFENNHNGHFQHVTKNERTPGLPQDAVSGDYLAVADYDVDGWGDVLSRKEGQLDLWRNLGDGSFAATSSFEEEALDADKGGVAFCDFDADGDFDILWTDPDVTRIWRNRDGIFEPTGEPADSSGVNLARGDIDAVACADVDNDGDIDLFLAGDGEGHLFLNESAGGDVAPLAFSLRDALSIRAAAESAAFGDHDGDGDQDLLVSVNGGPNQLWSNAAGGENFLTIRALRCLYGNPVIKDQDPVRMGRLKGFRDDIGATVRIFAEDGATPAGPVQDVNGGMGHGSQGPARVHYGLPGGPDEVYIVEVSFVGGPVVRRTIRPAALGPDHLAVVSSCDGSGSDLQP